MHTPATLRSHAHLNPAYFPTLAERKHAQATNRQIAGLEAIYGRPLRRVPVPKMVNRYLPHQGAKEASRYAGKDHL